MSTDFATQSKSYLGRSEIHSQWQTDYLNPEMDRFYDLAFAEILNRLNPQPGDKLLDAGCGYCYHTVRLARSPCAITSVDFSEAALGVARETITLAGLDGRVTLRQADLTALPFEDHSFDFVVSWGVLMHIPELERALIELSRALRTGGVMVLCENNLHSLDVQVRERAVRWVKQLTRRRMPKLNSTPRGSESWSSEVEGGLMVRKTDMTYLTRFLDSQGFDLQARIAGQFSEAYTNLPTRSLKAPIYRFNEFYFRRVGWAPLAMGNILFFRKRGI